MKPEVLVPAVAAIGFGIQQFLQVIADPVASMFIEVWKERYSKKENKDPKMLPLGLADADVKKALLGLTSFSLGLLITLSSSTIRILSVTGVSVNQSWDVFITALTISAGAESVNSVVKLLQYVKDALKGQVPPNSPVPTQTAGSPTGGGGSGTAGDANK